jgi:hypothetical protein
MVQADMPQIVLFMQTEVLNGSIFISTPEGRLLDQLNNSFYGEPDNRNEFLELTNVTILHSDSTEENLPLVHINKAAIQMAAITDDNLNRGAGARAYHNSYPFVEKEVVRAKIEMAGYKITGSMHRIRQQSVGRLLGERTEFIPLTHAEVYSTANGKRWHLAFLAVNKKQILFIY